MHHPLKTKACGPMCDYTCYCLYLTWPGWYVERHAPGLSSPKVKEKKNNKPEKCM